MKPKLKIVKVGGKLIEDEQKFKQFLSDFSKIDTPRILIHGGGNFATEIAIKLGYKTKMLDGRRITDANSMQVITMVYGGLISKNIVADLQKLGTNAIGLCGADARSIVSRKRPVKEVDYGYVGDIESVNVNFISSLLDQDITPVFSAISYSDEGEILNSNADSVAAEISKAMSKDYETELYYCFEKKGVLTNSEDDESVIEYLNKEKYQKLLKEKLISDGMLPKLYNCFQALEYGVSSIFLGNSGLLQKDSVHTKIVE